MSVPYLAVCGGSPYLAAARMDALIGVYIGDIPPSPSNSVAFSPNGAYLAVAHANAPVLTVYDTSNWSKVALTGLTSGTGNSVAFSPNGAYLAVAHAGAPFVTIYDTSDWSGIKLVTLTSTGSAVAFSNPPVRYLRGSVRDSAGNPAARTVRAYYRAEKLLAGETQSDPVTGDYELELYGAYDTEFDIQFLAAPLEPVNDLFFARATTSET